MTDKMFTLATEADRDPFKFEVDSATLTATHFADLDPFAVAELYADSVSDLEYLVGVFTLALSTEDMATLRGSKPKRGALAELHKAYLAHAGSTVGESAASSS